MKFSKFTGVLFLSTVILSGQQALAQLCPNPIPIECNTVVIGDNTDGSNQITSYPCISYSESGPEAVYVLEIDEAWHLVASADPIDYFDAAIAILPDSGGDCDLAGCIDGDDGGNPEEAEGHLTPGTYYIVVDGYTSSSYGQFELTLTCDRCVDADGDGYVFMGPACPWGDDCDDDDPSITTGTDADGDGFFAFNPVLCPAGTDCDDSDPATHPGAYDACEDGVDQDCDGSDRTGVFAPLGQIPCDSVVEANNGQAGATDLIDIYACLPYVESSSEVVWIFSPDFSGQIRVRLSSLEVDLALGVVPAAGACDGLDCTAGSDRVFGPGEELVLVDVEAGREYFVVVDAWSSGVGDFSLVIDCAGCTDEDEDGHTDLYCGGTDCDDDDPLSYPDASEACDGKDNDCDGSIDEDFELATDPAHCGACGNACPADQVCDQGECAAQCSGGLTDCSGGCFDIQIDVRHCGECDLPCAVPNAINGCQGGSCTVSGCETGFADCNELPVDGCEIDIKTDPDHCGECGQVCSGFPNAVPICRNGACAMGACEPGFGNCNGSSFDGCETEIDSNTSNCGACGMACEVWEFCVAGSCTDQCPDGLTNCGGVCMDTVSDPRNCGGCGRVCVFVNATEPGCEQGVCQLGICDEGFGDCNDYPEDGCETLFGSPEHCRACGDRCDYPQAEGLCQEEGCAMGACEAGWTDCNGSDIDGCEIHTSADDENCGECGLACGRHWICEQGVCEVGCDDSDNDGAAAADCGGTDCDDDHRPTHPGAPEICDGRDNDCDGVVDEGFDSDGDGYLDVDRCPDVELDLQDCDDDDPAIHPDAEEICNGVDDNCDGEPDEGFDSGCGCVDADHDGYKDAYCGGTDCNDNDRSINPDPDTFEACDGVDNDCDGKTDEGDACSKGIEGCGCATGADGSMSLGALLLAMFLGSNRRRDLSS